MYKRKGGCKNYRNISLLNVVGKVHEKILMERVRMITNGIMGEEQCGFMTGQSYVNKVFVPREVAKNSNWKRLQYIWHF